MPPQRTESLARELMRSLLGTNAAPTLEVERGPIAGDKRMLAPPESTLVIGRGDEATWCVLDEDLSRTHAEVRRGWDGTRIVDLGSKNGTLVDGVAVGTNGETLHDGALVELGKVALRFRDPAERQLGAAPKTQAASPKAIRPAADPAPVPPSVTRPSTVPFYLAIFVMVTALTGLVWMLAIA
jgi:predicted component of type VI protein secretion system